MFSGGAVIGRVGNGAATLRKRIGYRNSFQTVLAVEWRSASSGTRVECTGRLHAFVMVFLVLWFGLALLIGGALFVAALVGAIEGDGSSVFTNVSFLVLGGAAIVLLGRLSARNEEAYLLNFVRNTLEAS